MALGWIENLFLGIAAALLLVGMMIPRLRAYRPLIWGSGALMLITALIPRPGNGIGQYLFNAPPTGLHLPLQLFGLAWWILGAWLVKSALNLVLQRTIFPHDNQPHARRLFADLASGLVYVVAFVGIIETVLKQPISGIVATSGVLAIVLGLALQNTLADVFSGLALNIEHPFKAGDWITMTGGAEGQVLEINWRATRIKSAGNDLVIIPNSIIAKTIVTNHRRLNDPHLCTFGVKVDHRVLPAAVIETLRVAAAGTPGIASHPPPTVCACALSDSLVCYELYFGVEDYTLAPGIQSEVIMAVIAALHARNISIGTPPIEVRMNVPPVAPIRP